MVVLLVLSLLAAIGGEAVGKKKKKKKPQPVVTTFYLHGAQQLGEAEIPDRYQSDAWHPMDTTEPEGGSAKSQFVTNYVAGPNSNCSGNGLLPVWKGDMAGHVVGSATFVLHTEATPGAKIQAKLFPDANGGCNEDSQEPVGDVTVDVPAGAGTVEIVFEDLDFEAVSFLALQLNSPLLFDIPDPGGSLAQPGQVRIYYDSAETNSNVELSCFPAPGATACATG